MRVINRMNAGLAARVTWMVGAVLALGLTIVALPAMAQSTLDPSVLPNVKAATFEVVAAKPEHDPLTYAKPLPMDLLPYQERTDKYHSIGTAFAIGPNRYVTAGHVLLAGLNSLWGPLELRDAAGHVYAIDTIEKFSLRKDFVVFSLKQPPAHAAQLPIDAHPAVNSKVYAVGNALGTGVVVRGGLYTSDTPENQDGAWKWIRFSAAASPGNSGGPLLDDKGKVIGVVLMKSANENLNFALPMSEVLKAPANTAVIDRRGSYGFPLIVDTHTGTFKATFKLPMSLAQFYATYLAHERAYVDRELKALLAENAATMFPHGAGSNRLLYAAPAAAAFPTLLTRQGNGDWSASAKKSGKFQLGDNGFLRIGIYPDDDQHVILFHLRKPDSVPAAKLYGNPEELTRLILKAGFMTRNIKSSKTRITSFGKPLRDISHTDKWQRHWRITVWPIPFGNSLWMLYALPVPDGYVGFFVGTQAANEHDFLTNLEAMTDYFYTGYTGTLAQWQDFLKHGKLLPAAFKDIHLGIDYGKRFSYASPRLTFAVTPKVQKIGADSKLDISFSYFRDHDKVVWGVSGVHLLANAHDDNAVSVYRYPNPKGDPNEGYANEWKEALHRQPPFDGVAIANGEVMRVTHVVGGKAGSNPSVLYIARYQVEGKHPDGFMKKHLGLLLKGLAVHEN